MRKRYLSFLLSLIIFLTSFTPAFADSVEVLEPIMSGVESSEEKDNSSDSVFILNSRDNNGKVIENKESSSNSVSMPNIILEERKEESSSTKANKTSDSEYKEIKPIEEVKPIEKNKKSVEPKKEESSKEKSPVIKEERKDFTEKTIKNPVAEKNESIVNKNNNDVKNSDKLFSATRISLFDEITGKEELEFSDNILNLAVLASNITKPTGGWETYEIGNGWTLGDFAYDGNTVTIFSEQGKEKAKTNKNLVVPSVIPDNSIEEFNNLKPVTTIGSSAFKYNKLTSVAIPEGITTIESGAFENNQLTSIVIPEGVTTIEEAAFWRNQLTSVVIPEGVTTIGKGAFSCNQLTNVVIPGSVFIIGNYAFSRNQLTNVVISKGVTTIGEGAFYHNQLTSVVMPDGVTTIRAGAFKSNKLKRVNIPLSLKEIGKEAFVENFGEDDNHNVTLLTPDGTNPNNLQNESTTEERFVFPDENAKERQWVNNYTSGHKINPINWFEHEIGKGWTLGDFTYEGNTVTGFSELGKEKVKTNKDLVLPSVVPDNNIKEFDKLKQVTTIGESAFRNNQLTSIIIPDSLTTIGNEAFRGNELTSVVVPSGNVGTRAFYDNLLTNVVIGDGVKTIGEGAFAGYINLSNYKGKNSGNPIKNLILGKSLATIGNYAFNSNQLTSVVIPDSVTSIREAAFEFNKLTSVVIPDSVFIIGGAAFAQNQLKSVVLGNSVATIGFNAFKSNKLKKVYIPLSLQEIGKEAFAGNLGEDNNHNVTLLTPDRTNPNNLQNESTTKEQWVFPNEDATEGQWVDNYTSGHKINPINWFEYEIGKGWVLGDFTYDGNTVTGFSEQGKEKVKTNKDLVMPSVVPEAGVETFDKLKPVTTIGDSAFDDEGLMSLVVSKNVTSIGMNSFYHNKLNSVVFSQGLLNIGDGAFGYNLLTEVVLPSAVNSIGIGAFTSNKIKKVILPDGLTNLGSSSFMQNELTEITIPKNLKIIDSGAFYYNKINSVKFLGNVEKIVSNAFGENKLTVLNIPDSVKEIDKDAFLNNPGANNEKQVILYTESKNNPNNLSDSKYHRVDPMVNINVWKTDNEGNPLDGVEFAIFKGNKVVYGPIKTNQEGIAVFEKVLIDVNETEDLILKEISTIKGYQLDKQETVLDLKNAEKEISIFLEGNKTQLDLPNTGTLNELPFIGTAILLLAISIFLRKKKVAIE